MHSVAPFRLGQISRHSALAAAFCLVALPCVAAAPAALVQVTGMVAHPGPVALGALKQASFNGAFQAMGGAQKHIWSGPLLLDVLDQAGVTDAPGKKTHLRHTVLATGADGYAVAISIGEIDPIAEGKQVIVAIAQDGAPLQKPRLVVPGDSHAARGVHDLVSLSVQ